DLLALGPTANLGLSGVTNPAARLSNIVVETTARLFLVTTEPHYDLVTTPGTDRRLGREMAAIRVMPVFSNALAVPYVYGGGGTNEADAWIAAASNALRTVQRPLLAGDFGIHDTLVALLLEQKIGEILTSRGETNGTNLTLFHFRPQDVARFNPDHL